MKKNIVVNPKEKRNMHGKMKKIVDLSIISMVIFMGATTYATLNNNDLPSFEEYKKAIQLFDADDRYIINKGNRSFNKISRLEMSDKSEGFYLFADESLSEKQKQSLKTVIEAINFIFSEVNPSYNFIYTEDQSKLLFPNSCRFTQMKELKGYSSAANQNGIVGEEEDYEGLETHLPLFRFNKTSRNIYGTIKINELAEADTIFHEFMHLLGFYDDYFLEDSYNHTIMGNQDGEEKYPFCSVNDLQLIASLYGEVKTQSDVERMNNFFEKYFLTFDVKNYKHKINTYDEIDTLINLWGKSVLNDSIISISGKSIDTSIDYEYVTDKNLFLKRVRIEDTLNNFNNGFCISVNNGDVVSKSLTYLTNGENLNSFQFDSCVKLLDYPMIKFGDVYLQIIPAKNSNNINNANIMVYEQISEDEYNYLTGTERIKDNICSMFDNHKAQKDILETANIDIIDGNLNDTNEEQLVLNCGNYYYDFVDGKAYKYMESSNSFYANICKPEWLDQKNSIGVLKQFGDSIFFYKVNGYYIQAKISYIGDNEVIESINYSLCENMSKQQFEELKKQKTNDSFLQE